MRGYLTFGIKCDIHVIWRSHDSVMIWKSYEGNCYLVTGLGRYDDFIGCWPG
jgi:hypothetical protein